MLVCGSRGLLIFALLLNILLNIITNSCILVQYNYHIYQPAWWHLAQTFLTLHTISCVVNPGSKKLLILLKTGKISRRLTAHSLPTLLIAKLPLGSCVSRFVWTPNMLITLLWRTHISDFSIWLLCFYFRRPHEASEGIISVSLWLFIVIVRHVGERIFGCMAPADTTAVLAHGHGLHASISQTIMSCIMSCSSSNWFC